MKRTASKLTEIDTKYNYDKEFMKQAYGLDGVRVTPMDYDITILEGFYGARNEAIVFYDEARERLEKASRREEDKLTK